MGGISELLNRKWWEYFVFVFETKWENSRFDYDSIYNYIKTR
jgi:hypothetical protein